MKVIRCNTCHETTEYAANRAGDSCPICLSTDIVIGTISHYWFDLAREYGYNSTIAAAELIREFYITWDSNEYATFGDFMRSEVLTI